MTLNLQDIIRAALGEDLPGGRDVTSELFVDVSAHGDGWIEAREPAIVSGIEAAAAVFHEVDPSLTLKVLKHGGEHVVKLERVFELSGSARSILKAERTALNLLTHLSGISTLTHEFVAATRQWKTEILCTRKTLPGLRDLQVAAVRHGGGQAYRTDLATAVLVKDNHLSIAGGLEAIRARLVELKRDDPELQAATLASGKIEVTSLDMLATAVNMGWRHVLLDNFVPSLVAEAVRKWSKVAYLEVSGGVTLANVADYACTGVQAISVGALTHSAKAVDFSLECEWRRT